MRHAARPDVVASALVTDAQGSMLLYQDARVSAWTAPEQYVTSGEAPELALRGMLFDQIGVRLDVRLVGTHAHAASGTLRLLYHAPWATTDHGAASPEGIWWGASELSRLTLTPWVMRSMMLFWERMGV